MVNDDGVGPLSNQGSGESVLLLSCLTQSQSLSVGTEFLRNLCCLSAGFDLWGTLFGHLIKLEFGSNFIFGPLFKQVPLPPDGPRSSSSCSSSQNKKRNRSLSNFLEEAGKGHATRSVFLPQQTLGLYKHHQFYVIFLSQDFNRIFLHQKIQNHTPRTKQPSTEP